MVTPSFYSARPKDLLYPCLIPSQEYTLTIIADGSSIPMSPPNSYLALLHSHCLVRLLHLLQPLQSFAATCKPTSKHRIEASTDLGISMEFKLFHSAEPAAPVVLESKSCTASNFNIKSPIILQTMECTNNTSSQQGRCFLLPE